jgi:hypothetical protein
MDAVKTAALRLGADEPAATALVAVVDGLGLQALVREQVTRRTEILDALTRVLTA